jgi:hypothetical protein
MPHKWQARDHRDDGEVLLGCWFAVLLAFAITVVVVVVAYRGLI